ncbi:MAG: DNA-directed RNA polymerase subunit omega [Pyrinomonadaceae bacterium]
MAKKNEETVEQEEVEQPEIIDPPAIDSKYRMIILAAQRSKQLQRGANPRVGMDPKKTKPTRIAMKEFEEKKVNFDILEQMTDRSRQ